MPTSRLLPDGIRFDGGMAVAPVIASAGHERPNDRAQKRRISRFMNRLLLLRIVLGLSVRGWSKIVIGRKRRLLVPSSVSAFATHVRRDA